jgi:peptidoglycan hydrolase CwlO-like protein
MVGCKHKNISNRNQGYLTSSESNSPTIASPGYTITPETQDSDLKSLLMMMIEDCKKDINKFLKEIQEENTGKQLEALKEETQKSLKELQEKKTKQNKTIKQAKEMNKTIQDLKMELEKNKEITKRDNPGVRKPRKEIRSHRCKHHQQNIRDRRENLRCRRYHRRH